MSIHIDYSEWRLVTAGGIRYKLIDGYPRGSFEEENAEIEEKYIIRAADLIAFVLESFPPAIVLEETITFENNRVYPGLSTLFTKTVSFEAVEPGIPCDPYGVDPGAPDGTYSDFLYVMIKYSASRDERDIDPNDPTTFLEVSSSASGEFIMIPSRGAAWSRNPLPEDMVTGMNTPTAQVIPEIDWTVRWPQIPAAFYVTLLGVMRPLLGHVNENEMPVLYNPPNSTMLFAGWSHREQYTWRNGGLERPPIEVDMKFLEKHLEIDGEIIGHNHFFREETGKFEPLFVGVEQDAGGHTVYPVSDLNVLFPPVVGP